MSYDHSHDYDYGGTNQGRRQLLKSGLGLALTTSGGFLMFSIISPNVLRWHSSTMKTMRFAAIRDRDRKSVV